MIISIPSTDKRQVIDITQLVEPHLKGDGVAVIWVRHTTAAVTTMDLDAGTDKDFLNALDHMTPAHPWEHPHNPGHFPDHLWASLIGPSLSVPFSKGKLDLGHWQRLVLVELDGPRDRSVVLSLLPSTP